MSNKTRVVPVEATPEMIAAGYMKITVDIECNANDMPNVWRAMLSAAPPTDGAQVSEMVRTAPERIWLQVSDDESHANEPFPVGHESTWCADSVMASEVEYVRADLAGVQAQGDDARDGERWRWCLKNDAFPSFDDANSRPPWFCVVNGRAYYGDTAAECVDTAMKAQAVPGE